MPSRANPYWTFTLWLTFQRHRQGPIGALARYVDKEGYEWPGWLDRKELEAYLREKKTLRCYLPSIRHGGKYEGCGCQRHGILIVCALLGIFASPLKKGYSRVFQQSGRLGAAHDSVALLEDRITGCVLAPR